MEIIEIFLIVVIVSLSGALSPGPLFFCSIIDGAKKGAKGGFYISLGHTLFEFPYVFLLSLGLQNLILNFKFEISLIGGLALIFFGSLQMYEAFKEKKPKNNLRFTNSIILGVIFTGLNPFFLIWWVTVGLKIILDSLTLASLTGLLLMYLFHIWIDFLFLTLSAYLAKKGINLLGLRIYPLLLFSFSSLLIIFGIYFIISIK
ncbi:hypothetical protein HRbin06_00622 [archaeon HR06]|nr:hypothetical protein HRbin06_00622 [archaeon HR06]